MYMLNSFCLSRLDPFHMRLPPTTPTAYRLRALEPEAAKDNKEFLVRDVSKIKQVRGYKQSWYALKNKTMPRIWDCHILVVSRMPSWSCVSLRKSIKESVCVCNQVRTRLLVRCNENVFLNRRGSPP